MNWLTWMTNRGEDKMTTTQIWMLCFVGVMVLLMILSAVWNQMGKKNNLTL